jgi:hypothetical protein
MIRPTTRTPHENDIPDRIRAGQELQFLLRQPKLWGNAVERAQYLAEQRAAGYVAGEAEIATWDAYVRVHEAAWDLAFDSERERRRAAALAAGREYP